MALNAAQRKAQALAAEVAHFLRDPGWHDMRPSERRRVQRAVTNRPPGPRATFPGLWRGGMILGESGQGVRCLWVHEGAHRWIDDRIVVKDVLPGDTAFADPDNYVANGGAQEPKEFFTQNVCRWNALLPFVQHVRSYQVDQLRHSWRIYTEFCDHGTLEELVMAHMGMDKNRNQVMRIDGHGNNVAVQPKPFHEAFLWYMFESLAMAINDLEHTPNIPAGQPPTSQVIHQNLSTSKILLHTPQNAVFAQYPTPQISEFGAARLTHLAEAHARNPTLYRLNDDHTTGFNPSELYDARERPGVRPPLQALQTLGLQGPDRITSKTNIWQIGRIILPLMRLEDEHDSALDQINHYTLPRVQAPLVLPPAIAAIGTDNWVPNVNQWLARAGYSQTLKDLVNECLQVDQGARPTPFTVMTRATAEIVGSWGNESARVPHYSANDPRRIRRGVTMDHERFRVGMRVRRMTADLADQRRGWGV